MSSLDGWGEWLNETLFARINNDEGDYVFWLGGNRWLIVSAQEEAETFVVELHKARVVRP